VRGPARHVEAVAHHTQAQIVRLLEADTRAGPSGQGTSRRRWSSAPLDRGPRRWCG
jgi:hypothetical protein